MPYIHAQVTIFRLITLALLCGLHVSDVALQSLLFSLPARIYSSFSSRTALSDHRLHVPHWFPDCSFSCFCANLTKIYRCPTASCSVAVRSSMRIIPAKSNLSAHVRPTVSFISLHSACFLSVLIFRRISHLFYNLSLSFFAIFIPRGQNEQKLLQKLSRLQSRQHLCSAWHLGYSRR